MEHGDGFCLAKKQCPLPQVFATIMMMSLLRPQLRACYAHNYELISTQLEAKGDHAMHKQSRLTGYLLVVISSLGFGTAGVWAKWGYQAGFTPDRLLALRFGIASVLMWLIVFVRYRKLPWPGTKGAISLILQGSVAYALTAACLFQAFRLLPAGLAVMLFYLHPVVTTVLATWLFKEHTSKAQIVALVTAVTGTGLLAGGAFSGNLSLLGVAFALLASLAYSGFTLAGQATKHLGSPLVTCAYTITACFGSLAIWAHPSWHWLVTLSGRQWGIGFGVALLCTVVAILLFLAGVSIIGASQTAIVAALEPASGVLFSMLFLGERLDPWQVMGIACILGSVTILTLGHKPTPAAIQRPEIITADL